MESTAPPVPQQHVRELTFDVRMEDVRRQSAHILGDQIDGEVQTALHELLLQNQIRLSDSIPFPPETEFEGSTGVPDSELSTRNAPVLPRQFVIMSGPMGARDRLGVLRAASPISLAEIDTAFSGGCLRLSWRVIVSVGDGSVRAQASVAPITIPSRGDLIVDFYGMAFQDLLTAAGLAERVDLGRLSGPLCRYLPPAVTEPFKIPPRWGFVATLDKWHQHVIHEILAERERRRSTPVPPPEAAKP